jgi:hypothetical protein
MTASPRLDQMAADLRETLRRAPSRATGTEDLADAFVDALRENLPDADPATLGAVLMELSTLLVAPGCLHAAVGDPTMLRLSVAFALGGTRLYTGGGPQ